MNGRNDLWQLAQSDLTSDGALRDIYVDATSIEDWQKLLRLAEAEYGPVNFSVAVNIGPPPPALLPEHFGGGPKSADFSFHVGKVPVTAYLFQPNEIELSFAPNDVQSIGDFDDLVAFITRVGMVLGRPVEVTHENMRESVFLRFDPVGNEVSFVPSMR